jgi:hypothetical protein
LEEREVQGGGEASQYSFVTMEVPTDVKLLLKPGLSKSDYIPFALTDDAWNAVCAYLAMLDKKLPDLQDVIAKDKLVMTEIVMGVEDDIGAVVAALESGTHIPGGPCVNLWIGLGTDPENNQVVANLVVRIAQQVKGTDDSLKHSS